MTNQQINYEIQQALSELDFTDTDFVHEIAVLCEDVEVGMDTSEAKEELAGIIEDAQLGKVCVAQIVEALTKAIEEHGNTVSYGDAPDEYPHSSRKYD